MKIRTLAMSVKILEAKKKYLPDPRGDVLLLISSRAKALANREVKDLSQQKISTNKCGQYFWYSV